jgi:hypothetical protein
MARNQEAWNQQTIEMIDALLTSGRLLRDRLHREYRRLKRLPDDEWEWLSDDVQEAISDLRHNDIFTDLLYPRDNAAMKLINEAAELLRTKPTDGSHR